MKGREEWAINRAEMEMPDQNEQEHEAVMETETPPMEYILSMPTKQEVTCPTSDCKYTTKTHPEMRRHFRARHPDDTIIIEEEGRLPRCDNCGIFQKLVDQKHKLSADCKKATKSRQARLDEKVQLSARQFKFTVSGIPIERVKEFKYLGRILEEDDNDWPALQANLTKARAKWGRIGRILSREKQHPV